jgi:hypothetical protein
MDNGSIKNEANEKRRGKVTMGTFGGEEIKELK